MDLEIKIRVGYRVSKATDRYPANVFNNVDSFLPEKAELKPNPRIGTYEDFKSRQDLEPASGGGGGGGGRKGRDTDTELSL